MEDQNNIYIVSGYDGGTWVVKGRSRSQDTAIKAADRLHTAKAFREVRVEKQFSDRSSGRVVRTTILARAQPPAGSIPAWLWIMVAFTAGIISFFFTYWLLSR